MNRKPQEGNGTDCIEFAIGDKNTPIVFVKARPRRKGYFLGLR